MYKRFTVVALAFAVSFGCAPQAHETVVRSLSAGEPAVAQPPPQQPQDPCWDHQALLEGRGDPARQDWFNHLDARDYARAHMACAPYYWDGEQFDALDRIVMAESKWSWTADNPHSSAYGIPQACPGSKMADHGADWRTNPRVQVNWMLDYIKTRFGDPKNAAYHRFHYGMY